MAKMEMFLPASVVEDVALAKGETRSQTGRPSDGPIAAALLNVILHTLNRSAWRDGKGLDVAWTVALKRPASPTAHGCQKIRSESGG